MLHEFACYPCTRVILIFSVSFQFQCMCYQIQHLSLILNPSPPKNKEPKFTHNPYIPFCDGVASIATKYLYIYYFFCQLDLKTWKAWEPSMTESNACGFFFFYKHSKLKHAGSVVFQKSYSAPVSLWLPLMELSA